MRKRRCVLFIICACIYHSALLQLFTFHNSYEIFKQANSHLEEVPIAEKFLRKMRRNTDELGYFVRSEVKNIGNKIQLQQYDEPLLKKFDEQLGSAVADIELTWSETRQHRSEVVRELGKFVEDQIDLAQSHTQCERILLCELPSQYGFGSQLHHLVFCLMSGFGLRRVVQLSGSQTIYGEQYESVFLPLTKTCSNVQDSSRVELWSEASLSSDSIAVKISFKEYAKFTGPFAPPVVPANLANKLSEVFEYPEAWWTGWFVRYALRLQPSADIEIESFLRNINFSQPIVGIHIRRTDKLYHEAQYHSVEEYVQIAENWFRVRELMYPNVKHHRRAFVATDDPQVLAEAKQKYTDWTFIGGSTEANRSPSGLKGVLSDVFALSRCSYVVCTFSSNVCRLAYELKVIHDVDTPRLFRSLDDIYYYFAPRNQVAVREHNAGNGEIDMKIGDIIGIRGNHWDGYSLGLNRRTNKVGLYPSYKARDIVMKQNISFYHRVTKQDKSSG